MKYTIIRNRDDEKLVFYNVRINGLSVKPINNVKGLEIKSKSITIVDSMMQEEYIKKRINHKIDKIISFMMRILDEGDATEEDTSMVLDEIARLKGIVVNKYKNYLSNAEYKALLTKLILIEEEFKKSYTEMVYNSYLKNYYIEQVTNERGR